MKIIIGLFLGLALVISCNTLNNSSSKNVELITKYVKAVEGNDTATMESLMDDNYWGFGPSVGDSINKTGAIANWKYNVENLYESITYNKSKNISVNISDGDNKGEWVSNWAELNIVYKKDKKSVLIWANTIYQVKNNKIIKSYTFYNEADVLEQLGFVFINPNDL